MVPQAVSLIHKSNIRTGGHQSAGSCQVLTHTSSASSSATCDMQSRRDFREGEAQASCLGLKRRMAGIEASREAKTTCILLALHCHLNSFILTSEFDGCNVAVRDLLGRSQQSHNCGQLRARVGKYMHGWRVLIKLLSGCTHVIYSPFGYLEYLGEEKGSGK